MALPPGDVATALSGLPESQWFDRKSGRAHPKDLARTIIAFANAEGGVVVVGLHDGLAGATPEPARLNELQQAPLDFTRRTVPVEIETVDCTAPGGPQRVLYLLRVEANDREHANQKDQVFLRVGDEDRHLSFDQRTELRYDRGQATYETTVTDRGLESLDQDLVAGYVTATWASDASRLLIARGLMQTEGNLTVGAELLFAANPQAAHPQAELRVLRHAGTSRETGQRQQLLDDRRIGGALPDQLNEAHNVLRELVPTKRALGSHGRFGQIGIIPEDVWLEGVVNAVIHRSYSAVGDHIRVEVFDDRIEIESPGRFPGIVDLSDPSEIHRFARTPASPGSVLISTSVRSWARGSRACSTRCASLASPNPSTAKQPEASDSPCAPSASMQPSITGSRAGGARSCSPYARASG